MNRQGILPVVITDNATFDNYLSSNNHHVVQFIRRMLDGESIGKVAYIWGPRGVGKTHLLYSACKHIENSYYIPLSSPDLEPQFLDELDATDLICIDDVHRVAGSIAWEKRIMALFEITQVQNTRLILTANAPPQSLEFHLPDLMSRLYSREIFKLSGVSDDDKIKILMRRASRRGIQIDEPVARFALKRYARDMHTLLNLLDRIDSTTLEQHRRVTIPFLKQIENSG